MIDYPVRLRIEDTPEHKALVNFIKKNNLDITKKNVLINSLSAFWMPFAIRQQNPDDTELRKHAITAIYKLKQHIDYLSSMFDIHNEMAALPSTPSFEPKFDQTEKSYIKNHDEQIENLFG